MRFSFPLLVASLPLVHASLGDEVVIPPNVTMPPESKELCIDTSFTEALKQKMKEEMENSGMCKFYYVQDVDLSTCNKACREDLGNPAEGCRMIYPSGFRDDSDESNECFWMGSCICKEAASGYRELLEWFITEVENAIEEIAGPIFCGLIPMVDMILDIGIDMIPGGGYVNRGVRMGIRAAKTFQEADEGFDGWLQMLTGTDCSDYPVPVVDDLRAVYDAFTAVPYIDSYPGGECVLSKRKKGCKSKPSDEDDEKEADRRKKEFEEKRRSSSIGEATKSSAMSKTASAETATSSTSHKTASPTKASSASRSSSSLESETSTSSSESSSKSNSPASSKSSRTTTSITAPSNTQSYSSSSSSASVTPYICGETRDCGHQRCSTGLQKSPTKAVHTRPSATNSATRITRRSLETMAVEGSEDYVLSVVQAADPERELDHYNKDDYAVSMHGKFGDEPFPVYVRGLEGCIGISIISERGYWMGYYKENAYWPEHKKEWGSLLIAITQGAVNYSKPNTLTDIFGAGSNPEIYVAQPSFKIDKIKMYELQVASILKEIQKDTLQSAVVHKLSYVKPESVEEVENQYEGTARGIMLLEYNNENGPDKDEAAEDEAVERQAIARVFLEGFSIEKSWNATNEQIRNLADMRGRG